MPLPTCRLAMLTTRRRFASMSLRLASSSWRSMRLASETSSTAVSSGTLPISWKYSRTGSPPVGLEERSSLPDTAAASSLVSATVSPDGVGAVVGDLDAHVGEPEEQFLDLGRRHLDVAQRDRHVGAAEAAQLVAFLDQAVDFGALDQRRGQWIGLVS